MAGTEKLEGLAARPDWANMLTYSIVCEALGHIADGDQLASSQCVSALLDIIWESIDEPKPDQLPSPDGLRKSLGFYEGDETDGNGS